MHPVHRVGAVLAVVLVGALAVPASAGAPPVPSHPRTFVLGTDFIPSKDPHVGAVGDGDVVATLVEVDPSSDRPLGRSLRLADLTSDEPLISPDRRVIAVGSSYRGRIVRVDPVGWRRLAPLQVGEPWDEETGGGDRVDLLSWPGLLIATTGQTEGKEPRDRTLRVVDPASGRVIAAEPLGGLELGSAVAPDGGVLVLSTPVGSIGTARLIAVSPAGAIRSATLDRIPGGWIPAAEADPGLAVDFTHGRAFVIARDVAAEVDLESLAVAYHPLPTEGTAPAGPPHRTGTVNPQDDFSRQVRSLGDGRLALSGIDEAIVGPKQTDRPAGLRIIDTATWTARLVNPGVSWFDVVGDTVLASTIAWDAGRHEWAGYKLAAFDPEGRMRYRRYRQRGHRDLDGPSWQIDGDLWYWRAKAPFVGTSERRELRDPRTGAIVRRVVRFIGDYSSEPLTWTPPG